MSTKPIYNKQGHPVAWKYSNFIYDLYGKQLPIYLEMAGLLNFKGKYLGYFSTGFFRDKRGSAVAFVQGAHDGPTLPMMEWINPVIIPPAVYPPFLTTPPIQFLDRFDWSYFSWNQYIGQEVKQKQETFGLISPR
jgi:hypothetical protein